MVFHHRGEVLLQAHVACLQIEPANASFDLALMHMGRTKNIIVNMGIRPRAYQANL
jgi:hypothetical protein